MDKCSKEFPPDIKARWDALAGRGEPSEEIEKKVITAEELKAFEKYLFGKEAATPGQVTAFVELMQRIPANEKDLSGHLFDELYKKFHQTESERETVHTVTRALLKAQHGEVMNFIAENHIGTKNPSIPRMVDKAIDEGCHEVLSKPSEHVRQAEQMFKSTVRRRLLHIMDVVRTDREEPHQGAVSTVLAKDGLAADNGPGPHELPVGKRAASRVLAIATRPGHHNGEPHTAEAVVKRDAHSVLPHGKLLSKPNVPDANHVLNGTPVQRELFTEKRDLIAIKAKAANIRPIAFKPRDESSANPNTSPSFRLVIRGGRSYYPADMSAIEERLANPVPVTEDEKARAERRRLKAERKAAYEARGGFLGMLGLARPEVAAKVNGSASSVAVQQELFEDANIASLQQGNGNSSHAVVNKPDTKNMLVTPTPVTDKEKYKTGGGFMGMVGRAANGLFTSRVKDERAQAPSLDDKDMVRGK